MVILCEVEVEGVSESHTGVALTHGDAPNPIEPRVLVLGQFLRPARRAVVVLPLGTLPHVLGELLRVGYAIRLAQEDECEAG